jgi:hypothetical protein
MASVFAPDRRRTQSTMVALLICNIARYPNLQKGPPWPFSERDL